ncbi:MAG: hypothetical protein U0794_11260 [Isosphaeraceae bacterium]
MLTWTWKRTMLAATGACALVMGGCGGPPAVDSSTTEATVKGVVKVDGEPVTEGEIIFDPANYLRKDAPQRTAPIGKDGSYTIKTLTGENIVRISGPATKKHSGLQYTKRPVNVNSGENSFDFVVGGGGTSAGGDVAPKK